MQNIEDQKELRNCLEAFLNLNENMTDGEKAAAQAQLVRESNPSYVMNNQKYLVKRQKKEEMP